MLGSPEVKGVAALPAAELSSVQAPTCLQPPYPWVDPSTPGMGPAPNILELPLILYFVPTLDWEEWVCRKH